MINFLNVTITFLKVEGLLWVLMKDICPDSSVETGSKPVLLLPE